MDLAHHLFPQLGGGVARGAHLLVLVIAGPHGGGVIGGVAHEPAVIVLAGGTRLTGGGHVGQGGLIARSAGDHVPEHGVHIIGGGFFNDGLLHAAVVQQDLARAVLHPGIGAGIGVNALVGEGGIGLGHVTGTHALGQTAHGQGGHVDVAAHLAVFGDHGVHQVDVIPVLDEVEALLGGDHVGQQTHGDGVHRVGQAAADGSQALIPGRAGVDGPAGAVAVVIGVVVHHRDGGDLAQLQGRGVDGQGL